MSDIFSKRFSTAPALPADESQSSAWRRALTLPSLPDQILHPQTQTPPIFTFKAATP